MARDFITVTPNNTTATQALKLKSYIANLRIAYSLGAELIGVMGHLNDGTNFSDIETQFGLPAGKGQTVFDLLNGSWGSMNGTFQVSDAKTITEKVG